jgi:glutathione S-transferase
VSGKRGAGGAHIVLYRCPNPTNVLCPCGAVARRLGKLGLEYRTERVPYRRSSRPEIEELTRQRRVPVLVDGDEVVHDSRRIIQYLEWKYRPEGPEEGRGARATEEVPHGEARAADEVPDGGLQPAAHEEAERAASSGLYNLKRWRHRKKRSS